MERLFFSGPRVALFWMILAGSANAAPYQEQWALENTGQKACAHDGSRCSNGTFGADIGASKVNPAAHNCSSVIVAVLDTGVDASHPDLQGNLLAGKNIVSGAAGDHPDDDNFHGTHVTGIIAGNGNESRGVVGVCRRAKVLPVKVASAEGYLSDADILQGIEFAVSQGARVVNASFGGGGESALVKRAIASAPQTLFVVAAGNGDRLFGVGYDVDKSPVFPVSYKLSNIIGVAATDNQDGLARFSNFGAEAIHLSAPGVNTVSAMPMRVTEAMVRRGFPAELASISGTSMAAPYVSGAIAYFWASHPDLRAEDVRAKLLASVSSVGALKGKVATGGRLSLARLMGAEK